MLHITSLILLIIYNLVLPLLHLLLVLPSGKSCSNTSCQSTWPNHTSCHEWSGDRLTDALIMSWFGIIVNVNWAIGLSGRVYWQTIGAVQCHLSHVN